MAQLPISRSFQRSGKEAPDSGFSTDIAVIDDKARVVGKMIDIVYDDTKRDSDFLVVDPGRFRACRCVPTDGSYTSASGKIVVSFARWWVMCSPRFTKGQVISKQARARVAEYYGEVHHFCRKTGDLSTVSSWRGGHASRK